MPVLLQINELHKAYGAVIILDEASASFSSDQKIGMIGRNGAGKSTLCRIITGHEQADGGTITKNSALRLSYLEQHNTFQPGETGLDYLMRRTAKEHWECGAMAARFRIDNDMLEDHPAEGLPGGYQTRIKLTAMLLTDPNFLILDEPSNYLDLNTLILLENFLTDFRGGYLIVSHDREFIKRTCEHTLELENGSLTLYPGNIEEYFEFKEEQVAQKQAYNRSVEKKREQLQAFVDRFRAKASTATRAQSKMKQIEKLKTIEIAHTTATVRIFIPQVEAKAGIAFSCNHFSIGYPDKTVASNIHFEVEKGERVAVLGNNGEGKTTFLKTIGGDLKPVAGQMRWGSGLKIAYYAQHVFSSLNPEDDIYAHLLRESAPEVTSQQILAMAGCFLFKGDEVKKKVKVLSGGERARLLLSKSNVLLLDEPTNHLDFETVEALARALRGFSGTVFFISHDRTFVNIVATSILEVKGGRIKRYPGTYEDYVYHLEMLARGEIEESSGKPEGCGSSAGKSRDGASDGASGENQEDSAEKSASKGNARKQLKAREREQQRLRHLIQERDRILKDMAANPFHFSKDRNARLKSIQVEIEESEAKLK